MPYRASDRHPLDPCVGELDNNEISAKATTATSTPPGRARTSSPGPVVVDAGPMDEDEDDTILGT